MDMNDKILEELVQIRKMLTVLSYDKLAEFKKQIEKEYVTTKPRREMYDLFDGTKSLKEISEAVKATFEAVRLFASILEKAGCLEYVSTSKSKNQKKIF